MPECDTGIAVHPRAAVVWSTVCDVGRQLLNELLSNGRGKPAWLEKPRYSAHAVRWAASWLFPQLEVSLVLMTEKPRASK